MDSFVRAMMSSAPCFLITTPVSHYLGQEQALTGTGAVFSSVFANSLMRLFFVTQLIDNKRFLHIKIHVIQQNTPNNLGQFVGSSHRGFHEPALVNQFSQPLSQIIIPFLNTTHHGTGTVND